MSTSIDERVVRMTFRSAEFLRAADQVITALQTLKTHLNGLKGTEKGLSGVGAAANKIDLSRLATGVDAISSRFSALGVMATSALATIASRAVTAGMALVKSFTVAPVIAGLHEYETTLNSIQVILANTGKSGKEGVNEVKGALDELNTYADQTIYNFEQMAANIGKFTAAGVSLDKSVASIKGIANLAALSGSSAEQASVAMYQLSQAIASGTIRLVDWNSVVNAGMGGKVFQNSLIDTARVHGVSVDAMIKKNGSFRDSLQEGWLTSDIMTETLSKFTGDLSAAQLKALGYTDAQTKAILKQAKAAVDSATKVRTLTQMISTVGEAVQSAWARVWAAVFGDIDQATTLFTGIGNALSKVFVGPIDNLGKLLEAWSKLGGRAVLIDALSDALRILGSILKPIGQAFRDVFPAATAQNLVVLTAKFHDFVNSLKPSTQTLENLHRIFEGLFSAVKIGLAVVKGVIGIIGSILGAASGAGGGILSLAAKFGTFLTNLRKTIESGTVLTRFFQILATVLSAPVRALGWIIQRLDDFAGILGKVLAALGPFVSKMAAAFKAVGSAIMGAIRTGDLSNIVNVINQVLLGGILLAIRNFVKKLSSGRESAGLLSSIKNIFGGLTDALKTMQTSIQAATLQKIAIAVALLTASVLALSFVDAARLTKSLSAISVMFAQLLIAMGIISKISNAGGIVKMAAVSASLNLLASSVLILSAAVAILAQFSWEQLAKGVSAIAVLLGVLVVATDLMAPKTKQLISAAVAMNLMAVALNILAAAVAILGRMKFSELAKGTGTIAALLVVVTAFGRLGKGENLISTAASILILGAALNVIALAVKSLGSLSVATLAKGLIAIAAGLVIISFAMRLMPAKMTATAAGLLIVSVALEILSRALGNMGGMSWGEIGKSLVELAGALVIIAAAMTVMTGALPGAAALLVVSAALTVLTPVLMALGSMSWQSIVTGLATLAGVLIIFAGASLLLAPVVPVLLAVSGALALFGIGLLALGAGIALAGTGLLALGVAVTASGAAIIAFVTSVLNLIPFAMKKIGEGILAFAAAIGKGGPAITQAFTAILTAVLNSIIRVTPLIGKAISVILDTLLRLILTYTPKAVSAFVKLLWGLLNAISANLPRFVSKGAEILVKFLQGIANNLSRVATAATNVVIAFINAIGKQSLRVTQAAMNMIINFVNGLASQIRGSSGAMRAAGWNLASAIIDGMSGGLASKAGGVISQARNLASSVANAIGGWLGIGSPAKKIIPIGAAVGDALSIGLVSTIPNLVKSAEETSDAIFRSLIESLENPDFQPKITPVIDMSQAKKGFDDLAAMSRIQLVPVTSAASAASVPRTSATNSAASETSAREETNLTFYQYNSSPKALSDSEIYRQTKNQLSVAKEALAALCLPW